MSMSERSVILGIGNPGKQYERTRHNIGFMVVDRLAQRLGTAIDKRKWQARLGEAVVPEGGKLLLVEPQTYVNRCGPVARQILDFYKLDPADLLVVVDDLNLPFGDIRLRAKGSHGGHNGLKDIERHCGREYPRLRLGIGQPQQPGAEQIAHVLGAFAPDEQADLVLFLDKAVAACETWVREGMQRAMNHNGPLHPPPPKPKPTPPPEDEAESAQDAKVADSDGREPPADSSAQ